MRRLRRLVSLLMVVMIVGMVAVVVLMVVRLGAVKGPRETIIEPVSAESFSLPPGEEVIALSRGPGEVLMLTRNAEGSETLRVFDAKTGAERSATAVERE